MDDDVRRPKPCQQVGRALRNAGVVRQVADPRLVPRIGGDPVHRDDMGALRLEADANGRADAAGGTGDEGDLTGQAGHIFSIRIYKSNISSRDVLAMA